MAENRNLWLLEFYFYLKYIFNKNDIWQEGTFPGVLLEVGCKMQNFQNTTGLCFLVEFWPKTKISNIYIYFSNSINSPPKNCLGANLALIFVNFYICSKLKLIIWFWTIILFIILYFQFGGVLGNIFLPKFLNFEIHNGGYLVKKFWQKNTNFSINFVNSRCLTIPKMCLKVG